MKNNGVFSYLGLAYRAGKLVSGEEGVLKKIRSGEAVLVLIAADASPNTLKKYQDKCHYYRVPFLQCGSRTEFGRSIGKDGRVIVAVTDPGFAAMIRKANEKPSEVKDID